MMQYGTVIKIGYILFALWDPKQSCLRERKRAGRRDGMCVHVCAHFLSSASEDGSSPILFAVMFPSAPLSQTVSFVSLRSGSLLCKLSNDTTTVWFIYTLWVHVCQQTRQCESVFVCVGVCSMTFQPYLHTASPWGKYMSRRDYTISKA